MILITINNYVHYFEHVFLLTFPGEENIIIKSLGGRFHRNGRIRPIGRLVVNFLIGQLRVLWVPEIGTTRKSSRLTFEKT